MLEECEIKAVGLHYAYADEFIHQILDHWIVIKHPRIETLAGHTRYAPHGYQERLRRSFRLVNSPGQVVIDPFAGRHHIGEIVAHPLITSFRRKRTNQW